MKEGKHAVFLVEHRYNDKEFWVTSALNHFLFESLDYQESRAARRAEPPTPGDVFRKLLAPQHDCWQATGVQGFLEHADAVAALKAVRQCKRATEDEVQFRLVVRGLAQFTEVMPD